MRRYRLPVAVGDDPRVEVRGRERHYLAHVLRLQVGDDFDAVDPEGRLCRARVVGVDARVLVLEARVSEEGVAPRQTAFCVHLFPCLPKGRKMDIIVRQATEAGVAAITPVRSERAIGDPSSHHLERWNRIAVEALQQSGRRRPPTIAQPVALAALLDGEAGAGERCVFFHEDERCSEPLHRILSSPPLVERVRVLVGPEGGLAPGEVQRLRGAGWRQAWLGPTVLRVETAAIAALGAVTIVLLESNEWRPPATEGYGSSTYPSTP